MSPGVLASKQLIARILNGDVSAAVELAKRMHYESITELVVGVDPLRVPSPALFDVLADGMAILQGRLK